MPYIVKAVSIQKRRPQEIIIAKDSSYPDKRRKELYNFLFPKNWQYLLEIKLIEEQTGLALSVFTFLIEKDGGYSKKKHTLRVGKEQHFRSLIAKFHEVVVVLVAVP
jgi:hypothetical protein